MELLKMARPSPTVLTLPVGTLLRGHETQTKSVRAFYSPAADPFPDEPTIGLDPEARREVWQQMVIRNKEHTTMILTTHLHWTRQKNYTGRIAFVERGSLIALDTMENLGN